jgi:cytochrome o ubiquinol oxidase subunit 2
MITWGATKVNKRKLLSLCVVVSLIIIGMANYFHRHPMVVLNPAGVVAYKERNLIYVALALSTIVVIPVFILLFGFAWKYRESNHKAKYQPNWDHNRTAETIWWVMPVLLISVLGVIAWNSSHDLDPYKALVSDKQPLQVQVVALDWKWLFIYPQQHIASVNFIQFPVNTPINYTITSDAPMNSLWIPALGGQVYAMTGMSTQLHLMANKIGDFEGSSANISGKGFAGMKFIARSSSATDFDQWVASIKRTPSVLDQAGYAALAQPSESNPASFYGSISDNIYDSVIMKYMAPGSTSASGMGM